MSNPGLPDVETLAGLGGTLNDYAPVEDASTDLGAEEDNRTRMGVAMMSHTGIRAWVRFTGDSSSPVVVAHDAMWGNSLGVAPTVANVGTGIYVITWPATVNDEMIPPRTHDVNARAGWANARPNGTAYSVSVTTDANQAEMIIQLSTTGAEDDGVGNDFDVFII